jgi:DNA topoisomerase-1
MTFSYLVAAPNQLIPCEAQDAGLVYSSDAESGISRLKQGDSFRYVYSDGKPVKDPETLKRIRSLAIPPAYEKVWICANPKGHLQATGLDARRRKQYRYHPRFREVREASKFAKLPEFAELLPTIRDRVNKDLSKPGMPREKALAAVVYLLERSLIRVGNEEYARSNRHYGLTTMLNRHAEVSGSHVKFKFVGKSGIKHEVDVSDRRLARIVAKTQELPGQELFNYLDEHGVCHDVTSTDVNAYLKQITGGEFTAKDFRTWAASVAALIELSSRQPPATKRGGSIAVTEVMRSVSSMLGNTPAICRKAYVHPDIVQAYLSGRLQELMAKCAEKTDCEEAAVAMLLKEAGKIGRAYVA